MDLLEKLSRLENEAQHFGFRWENPAQIIEQIKSELSEVSEHLPLADTKAALQEEIGDLLHAVFSLCVFCEFNPEQTLELAITKFERRFNCVRQLAYANGLPNLNGHSFNELMTFWDKAKQHVG